MGVNILIFELWLTYDLSETMPSPTETTKQSGFHKTMQTLKTKATAKAKQNAWNRGCKIPATLQDTPKNLTAADTPFCLSHWPPSDWVNLSSGPLDPLWLREPNQPSCERCQLVTIYRQKTVWNTAPSCQHSWEGFTLGFCHPIWIKYTGNGSYEDIFCFLVCY